MKTWKDAYDSSWELITGINCSASGLTSLEGAPSHVSGNFFCHINKLTSLKGAPTSITSSFNCSSNNLTSLEGASSMRVGGILDCGYNKLASLKNVHVHVGHVGKHACFDHNEIRSHVLGILLIDGLKKVLLDNSLVEQILNKHLPSKGMESVLLAQEELILAGYEEYAQL